MEIRNAIDDTYVKYIVQKGANQSCLWLKVETFDWGSSQEKEILQHNSTLCIHHLRNRVNDCVEIPSTRNQWRVLYVELANLEHN